MVNGNVGFGKDEMCSYKHTHNGAVHTYAFNAVDGLTQHRPEKAAEAILNDAQNMLVGTGNEIHKFIRKPFSYTYAIASDPNKLQGVLNGMVFGKMISSTGGVKTKPKIEVKTTVNKNTGTAKKIKHNDGDSRPHGAFIHNQLIDDVIAQYRSKGATDIRKNQAQVDYDGNTVGYNRPDIQFNLDGKKYNIEIDTEIKSSFGHQRTIPLKDASSQNLFFIIRAGALIKAPKVRPSAPKF